MAASAAPTPHVTCDDRPIVGFKNGQAGVEQLAFGDDDDIEAPGDLVSTKNLSNQSFSSIPDDRSAQLPGSRDAEPRRPVAGLHQKDGAVSPVDPDAALVDLPEFGPAADPLETPELHALPAARLYSLLTVRRLRPFARRRLSTSRPFFVLIRTRNPCVRRRRRRFGWNVRFPFISSPRMRSGAGA